MAAATSSSVAPITNNLISTDYIRDNFDVTQLKSIDKLKERYNLLAGELTKTPTAKSIMSSRFSVARCLIDTLYQKHTSDLEQNTRRYQLMYKVGKFDNTTNAKLTDNKVSKWFLTKPANIVGDRPEEDILNLSLITGNIADTEEAFIGPANEELVAQVNPDPLEHKENDDSGTSTPLHTINLSQDEIKILEALNAFIVTVETKYRPKVLEFITSYKEKVTDLGIKKLTCNKTDMDLIWTSMAFAKNEILIIPKPEEYKALLNRLISLP